MTRRLEDGRLLRALSTARLELGLPQQSDAVETAEGMTPDVAKWLTWPYPMAVIEAEERIAKYLEQIDAGAAFHFVLRLRDSNEFVGWTSMWETQDPGTWRLGLWIAENLQDRGLGTEAASAVIQSVEAAHKPAAIDALVSPENKRSVSLVRHLGMSKAGSERVFIPSVGKEKPHSHWKKELRKPPA